MSASSPLYAWIAQVSDQLLQMRRNPAEAVDRFFMPPLPEISLKEAIIAIQSLPEPPLFRATVLRHIQAKTGGRDLSMLLPTSTNETERWGDDPLRAAYLKNVWHLLPLLRSDNLYNCQYLQNLFLILVHSGETEEEKCTFAAYMLFWERRIMASRRQHCASTFQRLFAEVFSLWLLGKAELTYRQTSDKLFCFLIVVYEVWVAFPIGAQFPFNSDVSKERYYELGLEPMFRKQVAEEEKTKEALKKRKRTQVAQHVVDKRQEVDPSQVVVEALPSDPSSYRSLIQSINNMVI